MLCRLVLFSVYCVINVMLYCIVMCCCSVKKGKQLYLTRVTRDCKRQYQKKWRLYILPQYLANPTEPIGTKKTISFWEIHPCTNNTVYGTFGVVGTFRGVF